jgi:hypothetical protein
MEPKRAAIEYYEAEWDHFGLGLAWMEDTPDRFAKRSATCGDRYSLGFGGLCGRNFSSMKPTSKSQANSRA